MAPIEAVKDSVKGGGKVGEADPTNSLSPFNTPSIVHPLRTAAESIERYDEGKIDETHVAAKKNEKDKKRLSFLTLPPEVRNKIYHEYMDLISRSRFDYGRTLFQPVLTIVSKQVRAETLPIYYGENTFFLAVHAHSPKQWTESARKTISSFIGDSDNSPGSSSLRYLKKLNLLLHADKQLIPPVQIKIEMTSNASSQGTGYAGHDEYDTDKDELDELFPRLDQLRRRVRIGSTDLDWTDREAVRAACDRTAGRLGEILAEMERLLDFEMSSTILDYRSALDVVCMLASACPPLTKTVFIRDSTEPTRSVRYTANRAHLYRRERY